jgi:secreted trypsin-like serine protease
MASIADDPRFQEHERQLQAKAAGGVRVLGGVPVPPGQFMDCVAVGCPRGWFCTGTLIASDLVLSAAHCVRCASHVFFGDDVRSVRVGDRDNPSVIAVRQVIRHEAYRDSSDDLSALMLARSVNITPRRVATGAQIAAATDGRVAGFGWIDERGKKKHGEKRMVDVPIASHGCDGRVGGQPDEEAYGCAAGFELVARRKGKVIKDTCKGDSGGPLYIQDMDGGWLLAGVTSRGTRGTGRVCGDGGIYSRLDRYQAWIERTAGVQL